jgi:putative IMPACT (imprinted ancient) family translation regulator
MEGKPGCFYQDFDDDGEAAAGGRLLHMLQAADVSGVAVVVSRWFGGVLLGPARFGLINNTARDLLTACGFISSSNSKAGSQHAGGPAGGAANSSGHGHGKGRKAHHR